MEGRFFKATMSRNAALATYLLGYGIGFVLPAILAIMLAWRTQNFGFLILPIITAAALAVAYGFHPVGYTIGEHTFAIQRPRGDILIPYENIATLSAIGGGNFVKPLSFHMRSVTGFYGTYGFSWNKEWGWFLLYITRFDRVVDITLKTGRHILVSPDDIDVFVLQVREHLRG